MTESILVGVDESPGSQRALRWAAEQAHRNDLEVEAVHVLTPSTEFARDLSIAGLTTWRRNLRRCLQHEWVQSLQDAGVTYRTELVEDDTVEAGLLAAAARDHALLIVLGAHGNGEFKDRVLGSVIQRVAHRSERPVVIVPACWRPTDR